MDAGETCSMHSRLGVTCNLRMASPMSSTSPASPPRRGDCAGECSGEGRGVDSRLLGLLPLALPLFSRRRSSGGPPPSSASSELLCASLNKSSIADVSLHQAQLQWIGTAWLLVSVTKQDATITCISMVRYLAVSLCKCTAVQVAAGRVHMCRLDRVPAPAADAVVGVGAGLRAQREEVPQLLRRHAAQLQVGCNTMRNQILYDNVETRDVVR